MVQPKFKVLETGPPVSPLPGLAAPTVPVLYTHILAVSPDVLRDLTRAWVGHKRGACGV